MNQVSGTLKIIFLFSLIAATLTCCKRKEKDTSTLEPLALNQETVTAFAKQIVYSVNRGDAEFFNNAFDKEHIKGIISDNSLVFSSLDTDFGNDYFEYCFRQGDFAVETVNNGGDFYFSQYYEKEGEHHIIFRTYQGYGIKIEDYIVDTSDQKLKIKDGFIYNLSTTFSNQVRYSVLLNVLQKTEASEITHIFSESDKLMKDKKYNEAYSLLNKNAPLLKEYPYFTQSYLQAAFMAHPYQFINFLENQELDDRAILTHKLLYYTNGGYLKEAEETINKLIDYTGDDPIYLFLYAKANTVAEKYDDALVCLQNLESALPPLWDITLTKLQCCEKTGNDSLFVATMLSAKDIYGLSDAELLEFTSSDFPKMVTKVKEGISDKKE
ncbi:MAG: hypothetical protein J6W84_03915 [Bacteroidales bacterium]|nr:hypothetical protein [Bacteroidales bacterium]